MSESLKNYERLMQIIVAPYISEKGTLLGETRNQTIFKVAKDATKKEIKDAIELIWKEQKIKVKKVQTINVKGKLKRFGRFKGKRSDWKKAIVGIQSGQELNFANLPTAGVK